MATLTIDTHNFIARLKAAGLEEAKAEAIVNGLKEIDLENVATKEDLLKLENGFDTKLYSLETRLYKSGFFALLAQAALIVALIELLGQ